MTNAIFTCKKQFFIIIRGLENNRIFMRLYSEALITNEFSFILILFNYF